MAAARPEVEAEAEVEVRSRDTGLLWLTTHFAYGKGGSRPKLKCETKVQVAKFEVKSSSRNGAQRGDEGPCSSDADRTNQITNPSPSLNRTDLTRSNYERNRTGSIPNEGAKGAKANIFVHWGPS